MYCCFCSTLVLNCHDNSGRKSNRLSTHFPSWCFVDFYSSQMITTNLLRTNHHQCYKTLYLAPMKISSGHVWQSHLKWDIRFWSGSEGAKFENNSQFVQAYMQFNWLKCMIYVPYTHTHTEYTYFSIINCITNRGEKLTTNLEIRWHHWFCKMIF